MACLSTSAYERGRGSRARDIRRDSLECRLLTAAINNPEAREAVQQLAEEQAALRRVATLVAHGALATEVFESVATEVGRLFDTDNTVVARYDDDRTATAIGSWSVAGVGVPVGTRATIGGRNVMTIVAETRKPARVDAYKDASGEGAEIARSYGWRSSIAAPIVVEDRLWGLMYAATSSRASFPAGAEDRLAAFTDLIAIALANAESRSELAASRRRIVAASDEARRRIERDLHDGVQQQLVSLSIALANRAAELPAGDAVKEELVGVSKEIISILDGLVEIARGIHPAILTQGGLAAALKTLARRSAAPVTLDARLDVELPDEVQVAAYYVVSEALTNVAKHARASAVQVDVTTDDETLTLTVRDDGVGGAALGEGSGLVGLQDRVEALGGRIMVDSSPERGTSIRVTLPIASETGSGGTENALSAPAELDSALRTA
jgi:signal transduction histidine kinase